MQFSSELCQRVNDTLLHGAASSHPFLVYLMAQVATERQRNKKARETQLHPLDAEACVLLWRAWTEGLKCPRILKVHGESRVTVEPEGEVVALVTAAAPDIDATLCPQCRKSNALKFYSSRFMCFRCNLSGTAADWISMVHGVSRADAVTLVAGAAPLAQLQIESIGARRRRESPAPTIPPATIATVDSAESERQLLQWMHETRGIQLAHLEPHLLHVTQAYPDVTGALRSALSHGAAIGSPMRDCDGVIQNGQVRLVSPEAIKRHGKRLLLRAGVNSVSSSAGDPYTFGDRVTAETRCVVVTEGDMDTLAACVTLPHSNTCAIVGAYAEGAVESVAERLRRVNCIPDAVCTLQHHDPKVQQSQGQLGLFAKSSNVGLRSSMKLKARLLQETQVVTVPKETKVLGVICALDSVPLEFLRLKLSGVAPTQWMLSAPESSRDALASVAAQSRRRVMWADSDRVIKDADAIVTLCDHGDPIESRAAEWSKGMVIHCGYSLRVWQRHGASGVPFRSTDWVTLLRALAALDPSVPADTFDASKSWDYNDILIRCGAKGASVVAKHLRLGDVIP